MRVCHRQKQTKRRAKTTERLSNPAKMERWGRNADTEEDRKQLLKCENHFAALPSASVPLRLPFCLPRSSPPVNKIQRCTYPWLPFNSTQPQTHLHWLVSAVNCSTARVNIIALSATLQPKTKACQCCVKWGCQASLCDRNQLFLPMKLQNIYLALSDMMPKPLKANRRSHQSRMGVNSRMEKHCTTTRVRWEKFGKRRGCKIPIRQHQPVGADVEALADAELHLRPRRTKQNSRNRIEA